MEKSLIKTNRYHNCKSERQLSARAHDLGFCLLPDCSIPVQRACANGAPDGVIAPRVGFFSMTSTSMYRGTRGENLSNTICSQGVVFASILCYAKLPCSKIYFWGRKLNPLMPSKVISCSCPQKAMKERTQPEMRTLS